MLPQYNRRTLRAEEWLLDQQTFQGLDKAVVAALAQACRSEEIAKGREIQYRGQRVPDLLILREGEGPARGKPQCPG